MSCDLGILGGGISGISLASFVHASAEVLEAQERPGGLCRSFGRGQFSSDIGGHILFSKDQEVLQLMVAALGDNVAQRRRANVILFDGAYVKYPFENGLSALPRKADVYECLVGFTKAWHRNHTDEGNAAPPPRNLKEWCYRTFGEGIAEKYLLPYNEKIWKRPPEAIGTDWVDRVPQPPIEDVIKSAIGIETEGYTHQLYFYYPKQGGIESLIRAFTSRCQEQGQSIRTGFKVKRVRRSQRGWVVANDDEERQYRRLVSTMPVLPLLRTLENVPTEVLAAAGALAYNSLRVVMLGIARPDLDRFTAIYVPNRTSVYHRVCFNNAFSPSMAPAGCSSVSAEITCVEGDEVERMSDEELCRRVIADLDRDGLVERSAICEQMVHRERYAYVVYDHGYAERVRVVREFLASLGIHLAGRFAEYRYLNMDACVRSTLDLAARLDAEAA